MSPNNIVGMAKISGLDAISVSDHNTVGNLRAVMEVGSQLGIKVVPGMEVETEEEVHILTLYPDIDAAEYVAAEVYKLLPNVQNKPEIFGEQCFMDSDDNIIGYEDKLLLSAAAMSIETLFETVKSVGGLFIPAHVDRHSYSILTNLGFMPDNIDIKYIELSKRVEDVKSYIESRPQLAKYNLFRNSDAHYLQDISQKENYLEIEDISELFK